jgi:nucleoside phosphorylase
MGGFPMDAKFAVGDKVDLSPRDRFVATIKAVYTTKEGETAYAVDMEGYGTLRLCSEHTIVAHNH